MFKSMIVAIILSISAWPTVVMAADIIIPVRMICKTELEGKAGVRLL